MRLHLAGDASRKHDIEGAESEAKRGKARALHWLLLLNKLLVQFEGASQEPKAEAEPKKQPEKAASDSDSDSDDDTPMCQRMKPAVVPKKPVEVAHHAGTHTALSTTTLSIPAVGHLSVWSTQAVPAAAAAKAKSDSDSDDDVPLAVLTKNTADDNKKPAVKEATKPVVKEEKKPQKEEVQCKQCSPVPPL